MSPLMYQEPVLVLIGLGSVGSGVLEQLSLAPHRYSSVVVADSKHVVSGLASQNGLLRVLEAKRNGRLDSLDMQLDTIDNLQDYFLQGVMVINATPTRFPTNGPAAEERSASVLYDIQALNKGAHVVAAHKSAFGDANLYRNVKDAASSSGVMYVPAGALMGPTRTAEIVEYLNTNGVQVDYTQGVVNGTANNMLFIMSNGGTYQHALQEQIDRGNAEKPDGKADVQGYDTLTKMKVPAIMSGNYKGENLFGLGDERSGLPANLMARIAGNGNLGIEGVTAELLQELKDRGQTIKLVGSYDGRTGIVAVGPVVLPLDNPLAQVSGTNNILVLNLEGKISITDMISDIYGEVTLLQSDQTGIKRYVLRTDYRKMLSGGSLTNNNFLIEVIHNPKTNQLTIRGPGAGSAETAAGLLGAADGIKRRLNKLELNEFTNYIFRQDDM